MKIEHSEKGIRLKLQSIKEKMILKYVCELDPAKKIDVIIEPAIYKGRPRLHLFIDSRDYSLFRIDGNEDLFCIAEHQLPKEWIEIE